jgi:hypothetical protein
MSSTAQSVYNALQIGVTRYFGRLNGSLAYTYGHSFRAEAFNVFNHTQWSQVNNNSCYGDCSASPFLTVTGAHNARILQLAGKFVF